MCIFVNCTKLTPARHIRREEREKNLYRMGDCIARDGRRDHGI